MLNAFAIILEAQDPAVLVESRQSNEKEDFSLGSSGRRVGVVVTSGNYPGTEFGRNRTRDDAAHTLTMILQLISDSTEFSPRDLRYGLALQCRCKRH